MSCLATMPPESIHLTLSLSGPDLNLAFKGCQSFATFPTCAPTSLHSIKTSLLSQSPSPPVPELAKSSFWIRVDENCDLGALFRLLSVDLLDVYVQPAQETTPAAAPPLPHSEKPVAPVLPLNTTTSSISDHVELSASSSFGVISHPPQNGLLPGVDDLKKALIQGLFI